MPDPLELLGYTFVQRALVGSALVGIVCGAVGVFIVLRGLAFLGDAVAHAAFPGVVIAFLLRMDLLLGGSIAAIGAALGIGIAARRSGVREDVTIGIVFTGMFALGVALFSAIQGYTGDLLGLLFGNVLAVSNDQLLLAAGVTAVVVAGLALTWKELVFVSFDRVGAAAAGLRVVVYDALLYGLIGLAVAVSIQIVGVVLAVAMLITPAAVGRVVSRRLDRMVVMTEVVAIGSSVIGIWLSYVFDSAPGATIVLVATAVFAVASLLARHARVIP
jgi:manganese/iron transport system permease protein